MKDGNGPKGNNGSGSRIPLFLIQEKWMPVAIFEAVSVYRFELCSQKNNGWLLRYNTHQQEFREYLIIPNGKTEADCEGLISKCIEDRLKPRMLN